MNIWTVLERFGPIPASVLAALWIIHKFIWPIIHKQFDENRKLFLVMLEDAQKRLVETNREFTSHLAHRDLIMEKGFRDITSSLRDIGERMERDRKNGHPKP